MNIYKILLTTSCIFYISTTHAKNNPEHKTNQLNTVIVKGSKTNQKFLDTPTAVSVIDEKEISQLQPTNVYQVLNKISGIRVDDINPFYSTPQIRGLDKGRILINLDGVNQSNDSNKGMSVSPLNIDPYLVKQIDVIKGTSGGLYGSGGMGGVISVTTKTVDDLLDAGSNLGGFVRTQYYSLDQTLNNVIGVYGRTVDENFDWLTTYSGYDRDASENAKINTSANKNYMIKTGYFIDDSQRIEFKYDFSDNKTINEEIVNPDKVKKSQYQLKYSINNGEQLDLVSTLNYDKLNRSAAMTNVWAGKQDSEVSRLSAEVQNSNIIDNFNLVQTFTYGIHYDEVKQSGTKNGAADSFIAPNGKRTELTSFIQDKIDWNNITFITSLRYVNYSLSSKSNNASIDTTKIFPSIGLVLRPTKWLNLNASYGEDFRAPSIDDLYTTTSYPGGIEVVSNPNLKPENSVNKEIGLTIHHENIFQDNDSAFIKFTYFNQNIENMITIDEISPKHYASINIDEAKRNGYEIDAKYSSDIFNITFATDYLKVKDIKNNSIEYDQRIYKVGVDTNVSKQITLSWLGTGAVKDHMDDSAGYIIHDLRFNYINAFHLNGLEINAGIDNLFNKKYKNIFNSQGRERAFLIGAAYKF